MAKKIVFIVILISASFLLAQGTPEKKQKKGLQERSLERFEEAEDWRAKATCPLGETKTLKTLQKGKMEDVYDENIVPEPEDVPQGKLNHILGVKTYFCESGFDRVEVSPPHEYILDGKPRQFSIWVLGRNYRHTFYIKLRDYRDKIHKLRMGRLNFFGWRKLTITVPGWLPQSSRFALIDKRLHFVSFFVVADTHETIGTFYFYIDNLRYSTDVSESQYPGSEIKDNW
jgi:hypothetical protein